MLDQQEQPIKCGSHGRRSRYTLVSHMDQTSATSSQTKKSSSFQNQSTAMKFWLSTKNKKSSGSATLLRILSDDLEKLAPQIESATGSTRALRLEAAEVEHQIATKDLELRLPGDIRMSDAEKAAHSSEWKAYGVTHTEVDHPWRTIVCTNIGSVHHKPQRENETRPSVGLCHEVVQSSQALQSD
mmetsp:Transcript_6460/g.18188  ORF Transcript_6460/g.18188 Transcript_6460/m.18188 type:complete len:185 (+) Transcript_6460:556-1110(+)